MHVFLNIGLSTPGSTSFSKYAKILFLEFSVAITGR